MLKQHCECIILALSFFGSCFFKVNISSIFSCFCHCHHTVSVTNSLAIFFFMWAYSKFNIFKNVNQKFVFNNK